MISDSGPICDPTSQGHSFLCLGALGGAKIARPNKKGSPGVFCPGFGPQCHLGCIHCDDRPDNKSSPEQSILPSAKHSLLLGLILPSSALVP